MNLIIGKRGQNSIRQKALNIYIYFRHQIKGGFAHDGVVLEAEVLLVSLADTQNDAVGVREHHIIGQNQIVFRVDDVEQALQVNVSVKKIRKIC